jgi:hypothetical protein
MKKFLIILMLTSSVSIASADNILDKVVYGWIGVKGKGNDLTSNTSQMLHAVGLKKEANKVSKANISFHNKAKKYEGYASYGQGSINGVKRFGNTFKSNKVDANEVMRRLK